MNKAELKSIIKEEYHNVKSFMEEKYGFVPELGQVISNPYTKSFKGEPMNEAKAFVVMYKVKKDLPNRNVKPSSAAYAKEADAKKFLKSVEKEGGKGMIVKSNVSGMKVEASRGEIHKAAKKGSYPATIVVSQVRDMKMKIIKQVNVKTPAEAPAAIKVLQKKYPKGDYKISLEDRTGKIIFRESVSPKVLTALNLGLKKINRKFKGATLDGNTIDIELHPDHNKDSEIHQIYALLKKLKVDVRNTSIFNESVNEGISVFDERHFGKKGIIIMIDDNGKKVSAIFKDKKNADKFNRNNPSDIKKLLQLAKNTPYPKAIDESVNEGKHDVILDKLADMVKNSKSFMDVGKELKKNGIKYSYGTSPLPMYIIDKPVKIAILNNKYADGAERVVGSTAIGLMESVNEGMFKVIDQIRQDSKDARDFIKNVFSDPDFKDMKKDKEFLKYLKSIYEGFSVVEEYDVETLEETKDFINFMKEQNSDIYALNPTLQEAEYQGRDVKLGKIMQGDVKKFKVYVKNPKGNVVKVNFGHGGSSAKGKTMSIKKNDPARRKAFRARHNCDNPGPRHKARYWSCRKW